MVAVSLCVLYTLVPTLNTILGHGLFSISDCSPELLLRSHAGHGLYMIFLRSNGTALGEDEALTAPNIILACFHFIVQFYFKLGAHYTELILLLSALTLRHLAKGFAYNIKHHLINNPTKVKSRGTYTYVRMSGFTIYLCNYGLVIYNFITNPGNIGLGLGTVGRS